MKNLIRHLFNLRAIASVILMLVLLSPVLLNYTWLHQQKTSIRHQVKSAIAKGMDKAELKYFKFSKVEAVKKLDWEHAAEFKFEGEMYDVVYSETNSDSIHLWCWHDAKETHINEQISLAFWTSLNHEQSSKKNCQKWNQHFQVLYDQYTPTFEFINSTSENSYSIVGSKNLINQYSKPLLMPPRIV